ncbi:cell division cycle-associated protein 3 isoform X2 [Neolamprologus brichardi]|uniref:cell division cycle-associated protein 3 isoform X2 n=1 Tax=Neolamprologus brichardi TaxID=32507 RepID=UPI0003EBC46F|nr:cell division cycle-associated protein 3 isoform X2 [Neolamprologus brichardi]
MGSSESKMTASAAIKPEPAFKKTHISHLIDPRSPSAGIERTPIQVGQLVSKTSAEMKSEYPVVFGDPRSPTIGITRTPVREVMRATVGSFARRLGMIFHSEVEGKLPEGYQKGFSGASKKEEDLISEELASMEPLLSPQLSSNLNEHANLLVPPVQPPLQSVEKLSPFVLPEEPQVEVEIETEADISLEEAEEARESPLHKRLSMSLITCHEGAPSPRAFAEVHHENISSPEPGTEVEPLGDGVDHAYALPSATIEADSPVEPAPSNTDADDSLAQPEKEETKELGKEANLLPSSPPCVRGPEQPQACTGIRCPTFDSKSPSQTVFKPQWLGNGFRPSGLRARGVQGLGGKGGSSPLAVRVAVKNVANENKGQSGKLKQKGTEGRSPLQILKKTNSPRDQRAQMKLKTSTPDKQRAGQMDRRVLAVCLDKENR